MSQTPDEEERSRVEAADWFARAHGPEGSALNAELAAWRAERPANEAAYARLVQRWDQSAFLASGPTAKHRDLRRAAVWSRRRKVWQAAAAFVFAIGIAGLCVRSSGLFRAPEPVAFANPERQVRTVLLADGSRLTLDAGSALSVRFEGHERRVSLLRGRAQFDIAAGKQMPVMVDAGGGSISAGNGMFDVSVDNGLVRVVSWRGAVAISGAPNAVSPMAGLRRISAGQQLAFLPGRPLPAATRADRGELGWTRGMLSFDRTRLADAVATMNRYGDRPILLEPPGIGSLRVTGAFRAGDVQGFARACGAMFDLSLRRLPDGTTILSPEIKT